MALIELGSRRSEIELVFDMLPPLQLVAAPTSDGAAIAFFRDGSPTVSLDRPPLGEEIVDQELETLGSWVADQPGGLSVLENPPPARCEVLPQ